MARDVALSGKIFWANKLFQAESYKGGPAKYSVVLYLDPASKAFWPSLKLSNKVREDENGECVTLRREHDPKVFDGKIIKGAEGGPPKVVDANGELWDPQVLIGNGSKATLILNVYDTKVGPGSRISRVRIDELVEYKPDQQEELPF